MGTLAGVYLALGWPYPEDVQRRVAQYAAQKPRGSRGQHRYSLADADLDEREERRRFGAYVAHYGIEEEMNP